MNRIALCFLTASLIATTLFLAQCSENKAQAGFKPPPMPVEIAAVKQDTVTDRFEAVGTIDAIDAITVVSEIDAIVKALPFHEGTTIGKGDLIAQLDDVQLKAELGSAEATRDQKKVTYERTKSLLDQGATAQQDLDNAFAAYKVAEAQVQMDQARLAKTRIVAPFSGTIGARQVSPGAFVRAGTPITDLSDLSELKVTFAAPEKFFPQLRKGAEVEISTTAYPDYVARGTIEVVEPVVSEATRSARLIAHVKNTDLKFRPGMSANVAAVLNQRANALTIPDEAIFAEGNQTLVYVVKPDSTVARTPITVGSRQRQMVEVTKGLEPGETVVRTGHQKLFDGAKVVPIPSGAAQGGQTVGELQ